MIERNFFETAPTPPLVIALGFFDCLHTGHRKIVATVKKEAKRLGSEPALLTFDNNFFSTLGKNGRLIYSYEERLLLLKKLGIKHAFHCTFDKEFMKMTGAEFLRCLFSHNIRGVVCGFDYTFGCDRADASAMYEFCVNNGVSITVIPPVLYGSEKISSTIIRNYLTSGDIDTANALLKTPYFMAGVVTRGRGEGKKLGFPTANLSVSPDKLELCGVFCGKAQVGKKVYPAIINCGAKPTFGVGEASVEAHLLDFSGDLYGKKVIIYISKFLRGITKFTDKAKLSAQLKQDCEICRQTFTEQQK